MQRVGLAGLAGTIGSAQVRRAAIKDNQGYGLGLGRYLCAGRPWCVVEGNVGQLAVRPPQVALFPVNTWSISNGRMP